MWNHLLPHGIKPTGWELRLKIRTQKKKIHFSQISFSERKMKNGARQKSRAKQAQVCRCAGVQAEEMQMNPVGAGTTVSVSVRKLSLELLFFLILWFSFHIYWFVLPGVLFQMCLPPLRSIWTWLQFVVRHVRMRLKTVAWKTSN